MVGVAGFPAGATLTSGRAAAAALPAAGRKLDSCVLASGSPGFEAMARCRAANDGGGGGGAFLAITCLLTTATGGALTWFAVAALAPSTLSRVGFTATLAVTGIDATCCALTCSLACCTGCAPVNVVCDTATTAPGTLRFTYVTLVIFVVLLTTVVLYTFVTVVTFTVVLLTFTRFMYPRLTRYDGTYTSCGPRANQPIFPPPPPPTKTTSAGAYTGLSAGGPGIQPHRPPTDTHRP